MYVTISGDPSLINMSDIIFEGKGNSARKEGNTLYVVWKSTSNMTSEEFSSFWGLSGESNEAKGETSNGEIVPLTKVVGGGGVRDGYKVCAQIDVTDNAATLTVSVMDKGEEEEGEGEGEGGEGESGEEESGGGECVVGMEGGEVEGEMNGEGVRVSMGKELKKIMTECEDISIVMNVTYGLSNG